MKLLLIDDDDALAARIQRQLGEMNFIVERVSDAEEALAWPDKDSIDAVILDLGLSDLDGIEVLQSWRRHGHRVPILVLSARSSWQDKVRCLDAGADDYMIKPAQPEELAARLKALGRRLSERPLAGWIEAGPVRLNPDLKIVEVDGQEIPLSAMEFRLLKLLIKRRGATVTQEEAIDALYPYDVERQANTIEAHVARLRRKIGRERVINLRGLGYKLAG